jgi:hypothetical protein
MAVVRAPVTGRGWVRGRMAFSAWYGIVVAVLVVGQWAFLLASGNVPELRDAPREIAFHIAAELLMALVLLVGSVGLLRSWSWAAVVYLVGAGMVVYSVINSPGYFAQRGTWVLVAMFMVLLVLTVAAIVALVGSISIESGR